MWSTAVCSVFSQFLFHSSSFFFFGFFKNPDCSWLSNFLKNRFPSFPSLTPCCPSPFAPWPFSSSLFVLLLFSPSLPMGTATSKTTLWFSVTNCSEPWWIWKEGEKKVGFNCVSGCERVGELAPSLSVTSTWPCVKASGWASPSSSC